MPAFKHGSVANPSQSGARKDGKTSCLLSPLTAAHFFSSGFLLALCLCLSNKCLKHSQTPTTLFGLEELSLKREPFLHLFPGKESSSCNEQPTQHGG